ncbi:MAG TPA: hypothetical protein VFC56_20345 [Stellaceae bacterium]|nr:hypothetical protein [Stellaceae bacterium]
MDVAATLSRAAGFAASAAVFTGAAVFFAESAAFFGSAFFVAAFLAGSVFLVAAWAGAGDAGLAVAVAGFAGVAAVLSGVVARLCASAGGAVSSSVAKLAPNKPRNIIRPSMLASRRPPVPAISWRIGTLRCPTHCDSLCRIYTFICCSVRILPDY